jgi:hypothetical protein
MNTKYFQQLKNANSDVVAGSIGGEFVRLAMLAASGVTSESERQQIADLLDAKGDQFPVANVRNLRNTANEIRNRWQNRPR